MLFDLIKPFLVLSKYLPLIFIFSLQHANFALQYSISLHFVLQFRMRFLE